MVTPRVANPQRATAAQTRPPRKTFRENAMFTKKPFTTNTGSQGRNRRYAWARAGGGGGSFRLQAEGVAFGFKPLCGRVFPIITTGRGGVGGCFPCNSRNRNEVEDAPAKRGKFLRRDHWPRAARPSTPRAAQAACLRHGHRKGVPSAVL